MAEGTVLFEDLKRFITSREVRVEERAMDLETPGEFDGLTITINPRHDSEWAAYYLAHSFGSICQWSTDFARAKEVFSALRRTESPGAAFEEALVNWRRFEETSSEHAVWVLGQIGHADAIDPYSVFFRADLEAMTIFHRTGREPRWPDFFAEWKRRVAGGEIVIAPFRPRPVPPFRPVKIEKQEVVQERD